MGQGQEHRVKAESHIEIQERGEIFFFYRPKVGRGEAHCVDDVQRLYIVLRPESGENPIEERQQPDSATKEGASASEDKTHAHEGGHGSQQVNIEEEPLLRFMVMGRKSLPDPSRRSRPYWGFVEMVTTNVEDVKALLKEEEYDTATRGHRVVAAARAVGEGVYRILRHKPSSGHRKIHTHLIYKLELPMPTEDEKHEAQESLNIEREGSFLIQIKNPDQHGESSYSGFRGLENKRRAVFPAHLQGKFGNLRYSPADPPDFLNYEGCEFLLISASDDIKEELGLELEGEAVGGSGDQRQPDPCCSDLISTFDFGDSTTTNPLLRGTWA